MIRLVIRLAVLLGGFVLAEGGLQLDRPEYVAFGFGHMFAAIILMAPRQR